MPNARNRERSMLHFILGNVVLSARAQFAALSLANSLAIDPTSCLFVAVREPPLEEPNRLPWSPFTLTGKQLDPDSLPISGTKTTTVSHQG